MRKAPGISVNCSERLHVAGVIIGFIFIQDENKDAEIVFINIHCVARSLTRGSCEVLLKFRQTGRGPGTIPLFSRKKDKSR